MHRTVPALRLGHFSFRPCYSQMVSIVLLLVLLLRPTNAAGDLFNYDTTTSFVSEDGRTNSYGPSDWSQVSCEDLESCPGWPEKWLTAIDWGLKENHCKNCAHGCKGVHHQSPIDLSRKWGYTDTPDDAEACIDGHWISYHDGTCSWDMLKAANAFSIERHALRIGQPLERHADGYRLNCTLKSGRRLFPRLDFPYGFSSPFFLSHTEIRVPSEHTQDGKRYHAEVQLPHFFSVSAEENNGVPNQMGTVAIFLEARRGHMPNPYLEKIICQFRKVEDKIREDCNMSSVTSFYPGCSNYNRTIPKGENRNLRHQTRQTGTALDRFLESISIGGKLNLELDPRNFRDDPPREEFINSGWQRKDHVVDYDDVAHHNYQWLLDVRTEYYFRYAGTQTIPPCYGEFEYARSQTNHWRVMKDPIPVHPRQIKELHRLLRERIAPADDLRVGARCTADTAAKIYPNGRVSVARPIQKLSKPHYNQFCECKNWKSQWPEDQLWCRSGDEEFRFFQNQYNAESDKTTCTLGNFLASPNSHVQGVNSILMPSTIESQGIIESPSVEAFLFQRNDGNLMVIAGNSTAWGDVLWESGISLNNSTPGSYYSELTNQGLLITRRVRDDGIVWSTPVVGQPGISQWFALDCSGDAVGVYQGKWDIPGNVTWKSTPLVPFAVSGRAPHGLHVPFHTSALQFTGFVDSDTVHEGSCWEGPVDAKPVSDFVCNSRGSLCTVGWTNDGEELTYTFTTDGDSMAPQELTKVDIILRLSSLAEGLKVSLKIDSSSDIGTLQTIGGGWDVFRDYKWTTTLSKSSKHKLRVTFLDGGINMCSISVL